MRTETSTQTGRDWKEDTERKKEIGMERGTENIKVHNEAKVIQVGYCYKLDLKYWRS